MASIASKLLININLEKVYKIFSYSLTFLLNKLIFGEVFKTEKNKELKKI